MRTKALLLAAAFCAAGVATSVAQVYSVNAVGYVNYPVVKSGFTLVANPLDAGANNTIEKLASNFQGLTVPPDGMRIFKFRSDLNRFQDAIWDETAYAGQAVGQTIAPGEGFFIYNPLTTDLTITFVGEVKQGQNMANPLPTGFSIKSNIVPQSGQASSYGLVGANGDRYFKWNTATQTYQNWLSDEGVWEGTSGPLPSLAVGEAFVYFRAGAPGSWVRSFNVNTGAAQ
jgi:hypothetical protein